MKPSKRGALATCLILSIFICALTAQAEDVPVKSVKRSLGVKASSVSGSSASGENRESADEYFEAALRLSPQELEGKIASLQSGGFAPAISGVAVVNAVPSAVPASLVAPEPIEGNKGKFLCPFTSDGVMAKWTDKAVNAKLGETAGSVVGNQVGQEVGNRMKDIPMFGMFLGKIGEKLGKEAGRSAALAAAGGEKYMRDTSDLSFNNIDDLAVYIYVNHSTHPHYEEALKATKVIYPELEQRYYAAISAALSSKH